MCFFFFFNFYQYFKEVDPVEGEHTFISYILNNPHFIGKPLTWAAGAAAAAMGIIPTSWMFKVFCKVTQNDKWNTAVHLQYDGKAVPR